MRKITQKHQQTKIDGQEPQQTQSPKSLFNPRGLDQYTLKT